MVDRVEAGRDARPQPAEAPLVRIVDLHKRFGDVEVLHGVSLEVARGEVVAIVGPSGSGKTTLLRCVNFLERPSAGEIWVDGQRIGQEQRGARLHELSDREMARERAEIGFVFQRFNLFPHLTALENVALAPRKVRGLTRDAAGQLAAEMLTKVGLAHKLQDYPERLSGGQQQRVAIARVLAMQPKLILFDEPTSALDIELVGEVLRVMRQLAEEGRTMLIVTHEIRFAGEVADRVVFMDEGRIVEQGPPERLLKRPSHERTRAFLQKILTPGEDA